MNEFLHEWPTKQKELGLDDKHIIVDKAEVEMANRIIWSVVHNCQHIDDTIQKEGPDPGPMCGPTWAKVAHICGLGSTSAIMLCQYFSVDPHYDCSREVDED